jgi:hypothetical protein
MPPEMIPVTSSQVQSIGYDADTKELSVEWKSGKTSVYEDVPAALALIVIRSPSVGRAINTHIKPTYTHRYV